MRLEDDDRPEILVDTDEFRVNTEAAIALANAENVYKRGGMLVGIVRDGGELAGIERPAEGARIVPLSLPTVRDRMTACGRFVREEETKDGTETKPAHPPDWCVRAVHARGDWPGVRPLVAVVSTPVLRKDGTILETPGYDETTGLYYEPNVELDPIPEFPSLGDVKAAMAELLDIVCDFPFESAPHRSSWAASVLTPLARFAFAGPSPLTLFDANVRGSGKSKLADLVGIILTGQDMPRMSNPKDDAEARKKITALAIAGDLLILVDNIGANGLGCESLDAALTATSWKDRILGKSEIVSLPLLATWYASGNNVAIEADTARRVAHSRLESPEENPEERSGFKYPNLLAHVRTNRATYLRAALTILRGYCAAGRPSQDVPPWGSFEGWSDLVRSAVVWAGEPDPGLTRQQLQSSSDRVAMALRALLTGWRELDPDGRGKRVVEVLNILERHPEKFIDLRGAILELCNAPAGKLPSVKSLGMKLRHLRGRVIDGKAIDSRDDHGTAVWMVVDAAKKVALEIPNSRATSRATPQPPCETGAYGSGGSSCSGSNILTPRTHTRTHARATAAQVEQPDPAEQPDPEFDYGGEFVPGMDYERWASAGKDRF